MELFGSAPLLEGNALFALLLALGLLAGWLLYRYGFRGLKLPVPLHDDEKMKLARFYESKRLDPADLGIWSGIMLLICIMSIFMLASSILFVLQHRLDGPVKAAANWLLPVSSGIMLLLVGVVYWGLFRSRGEDRLSPEVKRIWETAVDKWILVGGFLVFVAASGYALQKGSLTVVGVALGLFLLPLVLLVSRVEGRFFFLFLIQEFSRAKNWDLLGGKPLTDPKSGGRIQGSIQRAQAGTAIVTAILGVLTIPFVLGDFIASSEQAVKQGSTIQAWIGDSGLGYAVIFMSLGPLATLATRPFGFINVWLNQRLYEQIASPWDIKTMNRNIVKWKHVIRLPQPEQKEGFGEGIALAGGGILVMIALTLSSRIANSYHATGSEVMEVVFGTLNVLQVVSFFVLLASIVQLLFNMIESRTTWMFAEESQKANMDLINHSLYGLHWCRMRWLRKDWRDLTPAHWALPWVLYSVNDHPDLTKSEQLDGLKRATEETLPPMMKPVSWQQLGAFYYNINRPQEGREAFAEGLKRYPKFANLWSVMIKIHMEDKDFTQAEAAFKKAVRYDRTEPSSYCNWGGHYADREEWGKARELYLRGLKYKPHDGNLLFNYALTFSKENKLDEAEKWFRKTVEHDPFMVQAWLIIAEIVRDRGELDEAQAYYRKAIEYDPYNSDAWQGVGEMLIRTEQVEEAEKVFRRTLLYNQNHAVAWNNLGVCLREQGKFGEAVEAFRNAVEKDPNMLISWEMLTQVLGSFGLWAEAEATFRGAIEHHPENGLLYRNLAFMIRQQGRLEEALECARQAATISPEDEYVVTYLQELEACGGLMEGVEEAELETPEDADSAQAWIQLGEEKFMEGHFGEGEQCIKKALQLEPDVAQTWAILGDVLNQQGRFTEAEEVYRKALELEPQHMGAAINLGLALMQQGRGEESEAAFVMATEIDPKELSPWTYLFHLANQMQEFDKSLAYHEAALEHIPTSPEIWFSYGYLLARLRRLDKSEEAYRSGLRHNPEHVQMHISLGDILFHMERPQESIASFDKALEIEPGNVGGWLKKATVQMKSGDFVGADVSYRQSIELHPDWIEALYNLTVINAVLGNMDDAFDFAHRTLDSSMEMMMKLREQPELEVMRTDPRWEAIAERAG